MEWLVVGFLLGIMFGFGIPLAWYTLRTLGQHDQRLTAAETVAVDTAEGLEDLEKRAVAVPPGYPEDDGRGEAPA